MAGFEPQTPCVYNRAFTLFERKVMPGKLAFLLFVVCIDQLLGAGERRSAAPEIQPY